MKASWNSSSRVEPIRRSNWSYDSQGLLKHGRQDILTRRGLLACIIAWIIFIGFQIFMYCDRQFAVSPLCPHSDVSYDPWYFSSIFASLGGFCMIFVVLCLKMVQVGPTKSRIPLLVALQIVLMGLVANVLLAFWDWGGVCIDVLNVASPGIVWGEWFAGGPLLVFITVTLVDKPYLTRIDWFMMISFFVCLVCGFLIIIPTDKSVGQFFLAMSCLTYLPLLYLPFYDRSENIGSPKGQVSVKDGHKLDVISDNDDDMPLPHLHSERRTKRRYLMLWLSGDTLSSLPKWAFSSFLPSILSLIQTPRYPTPHLTPTNPTVILPFYTLNYLLGLYDVISYAQTIAIYQLLSVATKGNILCIAFITIKTYSCYITF